MRGKSPAARNCRDSSALFAPDADHCHGSAYKKASPKRSFLIDSTPLDLNVPPGCRSVGGKPSKLLFINLGRILKTSIFLMYFLLISSSASRYSIFDNTISISYM